MVRLTVSSRCDRIGIIFCESMARHILSIGSIPQECDECYITAGDPDSHGGKELTLCIDEDSPTFECIESDVSIDGGDLMDADDPVYERLLSKIFLPVFGDSANILGFKFSDIWMFFMDELEELPEWLQVVGGEDCGGEFFNEGKAFNGGFYVRYQFEEDDEFMNENIVFVS